MNLQDQVEVFDLKDQYFELFDKHLKKCVSVTDYYKLLMAVIAFHYLVFEEFFNEIKKDSPNEDISDIYLMMKNKVIEILKQKIQKLN